MKPTTTQSTGKGLKLFQLLCVLFLLFGVVLFVTGQGGLLPMLVGFLGYVLARVLIWWHHG
jgi:hypothetical protein